MILLVGGILFLGFSVLTAVACLNIAGNIDRYEEQQEREKENTE